jgi:hypothetical protein
VLRRIAAQLVAAAFLAGGTTLADKVDRGPYLQLATTNSIVIRWQTDKPGTGVVRFGTRQDKLDRKAEAPGKLTEHVVLLENLKPATTYYYAIAAGTNVLAGSPMPFRFSTPPPRGTRKSTRIWVLGDSGTKDAKQRAVRDAYYRATGLQPTDLWLMLGDNAYSRGGETEYQKAVFAMYPHMLASAVLWPTLGNHDGGHATSATQSGVYYHLFTLPTLGQAGGAMSGTESYYSFDYANIHFICLNSHDEDRGPGGLMQAWLKADLAWDRLDWTIAYWHHPPFTEGSHDSDDDKESGGRMRQMREMIVPVLEAGGVDLVLGGHSHSYERSGLMDGFYGKSQNFAASYRKVPGNGRMDGDGPYRKPTLGPAPHEGTVYAVVGSSGQTSGGDLNHPAMIVSLNQLGSLVIEVDGLRLDATFVDDKGLKRDWFTIIKGPQTPAGKPQPMR